MSGFDISEGRFNADLTVWSKWLGDSAIPPLTYANGEIESMEMVDHESEGQWQRPLMPYTLKYFLPLFIVLFMSIVGFFISPEEVEANLGLSVTALLTCVALHMSLGDSIPDVSYLLTVDVFFIFSYLLIFYNVIETV